MFLLKTGKFTTFLYYQSVVVVCRCCSCKEHIAGRRCDKCEVGYAGFSRCSRCDCHEAGVTTKVCDQESAECLCKSNVEGPRCADCKGNSFYLEPRNPNGCTQCFCFGITRRCEQSQLRREQVTNTSCSSCCCSCSLVVVVVVMVVIVVVVLVNHYF